MNMSVSDILTRYVTVTVTLLWDGMGSFHSPASTISDIRLKV